MPVYFDNEELIYDASSSLFYQGATPIQAGSTVRFVKISDQAPDDISGFRSFCAQHVAQHFRSTGADTYCAMRAQAVTER